ncbi:hypothetical protein Ccrd_025306 [Cynara cardunculus var. scolymus]|uniref:Uncharacterized protein n=1 Tax=Cynara cardunculus var. scolymus TaxID=59895 RepID=A0A118JRF9_CYNCS|nr:hypothetical protein Ccrd_025306 [Cynara cardunculus var. scolymus]
MAGDILNPVIMFSSSRNRHLMRTPEAHNTASSDRFCGGFKRFKHDTFLWRFQATDFCEALILIVYGNSGVLGGQNARIYIPDELDDVVDDEEDEAWKEWG